jgi:Transmembrane protein 231
LIFTPSYTYTERTSVLTNTDEVSARYFNASITLRVPVQAIRYTTLCNALHSSLCYDHSSLSQRKKIFIITQCSLFSLCSFAFLYHVFFYSLLVDVIFHLFRFSPPTSEVLKFAWIQYVAFFAVIAFLLTRISSFIFRHQVLLTTLVHAIPSQPIKHHAMQFNATPIYSTLHHAIPCHALNHSISCLKLFHISCYVSYL